MDVENECDRLPEIRMLVRRLITNSYWIQNPNLETCSQNQKTVSLLYDELGFPLTVQTVILAPGVTSTIHNHGTWGVIAVLKGQEKNTIWRRTEQDKIEITGELLLSVGDIISLTPNAIHNVEAVGDEPTVTFNIYGETRMKERFEFDIVNQTAKNF
jgi:predicted metal-dependent enzyme (double-stranded beta helix superfamily)